jgi:carotenoid cleavage dioxygenase-like enzyme
MVHAVRLRGGSDGGAEYTNRYVRTHGFAEDEAAGKRVHLSLTERPQAGPILRGMGVKGVHWARVDAPYWWASCDATLSRCISLCAHSALPISRRVIQTPNNANNGIKYHAGRLLATYEAGARPDDDAISC